VGLLALGAAAATAAELDVRLRFTWGGQAAEKWSGAIAVSGATLSDLQPLGTEADEAAAVRLADNVIRVSPLVRRTADGCDVTVRGDEAATVQIKLQYSAEAPPKTLEVPLAKAANEEFRAALDDLGGSLLVRRAPGDRLRVTIDRPHLVFNPGEAFTLKLDADLGVVAAETPVAIVATLRRVGSDEALGEFELSYEPASAASQLVDLQAPGAEGAYRISIVAQRKTGLAGRLVPWEKNRPLAARDVEFVVVDPDARLPRLADAWETVSTIDPANSSWWQRVPQWTQFDKLPGFSTPRPLGSLRPLKVADSPLSLVELPASKANEAATDPTSPEPGAWQAYLLAVRHVGEPHAVEIEVPKGVGQHMGVSLVEPDAAGRVTSCRRDCGVYRESSTIESANPGVEVHRVLFWPRTKSPALLLTNRSNSQAIRYGKIRLLRRTATPAPVESFAAIGNERLVVAYLGTPQFAETFGAAEELDASGRSVDGWNKFLTAASRLAQQLGASGYNAAIVSIAAEGTSLTPLDALGASPRFDTGALAASGADPIRKDVLEVLLRIFDREGLKIIPAIELAAPLPRLEALAEKEDVRCRAHDGRTWAEHFPSETAVAPHYNLMHEGVQAELARIVDQLVERYASHPSFAGLSLQLSGNGYGVLPGLGWGMDDATLARFAAERQIALPGEGPSQAQQRASLVLGKHLPAWKEWRKDQVTQFYAGLAARVAQGDAGRQLVLATEDVFSGPFAAERLRQAVASRASVNDALEEVGLDLKQLAAAPGVTVLRPRRYAADESVETRAVDHRINTGLELDQAVVNQASDGDLLYYVPSPQRLASFDAQSPFGPENTHLALHGVSVAQSDAARQPLASALTSRDPLLVAIGSESFPLADNSEVVEALRAFQELPTSAAEARTERRQPVTLRIYREAESTTVCLVNESRWPVDVSLPIDCDSDVVWRRLGAAPPSTAGSQPTGGEVAGSLARGPQRLELKLAPFAIHARRYSSQAIRVGDFAPRLAPEAAAEMASRIREIEDRMTGINAERAYNELQNPSFELVDDNGRLRGWQPRMGRLGAIDATVDQQPSGRAVHLRSEDALGVAVQSHLFAIPRTGQIVVRAKIRGENMQPGARLYAWVEYESGGVMRPRYVALGDHSLPNAWTEREFAVDDLPLAEAGQMRIQFHLTGIGEAWVDDVRLYDLRFAEAQRVELSKRLLGAKAALDEGHVMDCQRLVDGYLPRRLVEHIPGPALAAKPGEAALSPPAEEPEKGFGPRIRGLVPKILR
jgi:hypothetical protein